MYTFTNRFNGHSLQQRVRMINGRRSGWMSWWRYMVWVGLVGGMAFACRHRNGQIKDGAFEGVLSPNFPADNATRNLANELVRPGTPWFCQSAFLNGMLQREPVRIGRRRLTLPIPGVRQYPLLLCQKAGKLTLKTNEPTKLFVNGQEVPVQTLSHIDFTRDITDLIVFQKWADQPGSADYPESYRILISTSHRSALPNSTRQKWQQFLSANAISNHPLGNTNTYSMNGLLEATFFNDKRAMVERTKNEHLRLFDDVKDNIDLYINGLSVDAKAIEGIHVREVDKLYAGERPFSQWADGPARQHRFMLYVQTTPKRAKRDSSYYVFSPFYSGDF